MYGVVTNIMTFLFGCPVFLSTCLICGHRNSDSPRALPESQFPLEELKEQPIFEFQLVSTWELPLFYIYIDFFIMDKMRGY